ncbi:ArsC family reductase [Gilvimarinus polysaccharolyticus]|uniref:ArsC family reductase n=1 Tax=Gilvimarinus polysaccharolyticus TaxID=863921 RepID=UPI0006738F2F|nr:ArsC family reductase [Gilvimarinus polysaccharolyticus]
MTTPTLYGIKNCDTVKKARQWLDANGFNYQFHDFRADGLNESKVQQWIDAVGLDALINKRSTTWKGFSEQEKIHIFTAAKAPALIIANPTIIKRPVLETASHTQVGFKAEQYQSCLS